jgi:hypothetical protein
MENKKNRRSASVGCAVIHGVNTNTVPQVLESGSEIVNVSSKYQQKVSTLPSHQKQIKKKKQSEARNLSTETKKKKDDVILCEGGEQSKKLKIKRKDNSKLELQPTRDIIPSTSLTSPLPTALHISDSITITEMPTVFPSLSLSVHSHLGSVDKRRPTRYVFSFSFLISYLQLFPQFTFFFKYIHKPQFTNHNSQTTIHKPQITNHKSQIVNNK